MKKIILVVLTILVIFNAIPVAAREKQLLATDTTSDCAGLLGEPSDETAPAFYVDSGTYRN